MCDSELPRQEGDEASWWISLGLVSADRNQEGILAKLQIRPTHSSNTLIARSPRSNNGGNSQLRFWRTMLRKSMNDAMCQIAGLSNNATKSCCWLYD